MKFKDQKAIYLQIAELLCDETLAGKYGEGERIPSVREYAANVEVNVNTCMKAYEWLQSQDIIYNKRGLGFFVSIGAKGRIMEMRREEFFSETLPSLQRMIHFLGITPEELISHLEK